MTRMARFTGAGTSIFSAAVMTCVVRLTARGSRILLITDGIENSDVSDILDQLRGRPYALSVLGIGTPEGAPIPASANDFLRGSNGEIVIANFNSDPLETLADELGGAAFGRRHVGQSDARCLDAVELAVGFLT